MKFLESHFWYSKRQRNGILFLITLIVGIQAFFIFLDFYPKKNVNIDTPEFIAFQQQIDSLRHLELEKRTLKVYPFNPNYISDFKGAQLGMSIAEIDRLLQFRKTGKFVNSAKEFQQITKVSDSLFYQISPYFKFPDWVMKRHQKSIKKRTSKSIQSFISIQKESQKKLNKNEKTVSTTDLNLATVSDFEIAGLISKKSAERIVKYRTKLQGFSVKEQLYEVWNLDKEVVNQLLNTFKIIKKPVIQKLNINTATFKQVLKIPYIDYNLCKQIFEYRDQVAELQSLEEIKNINNFPLKKYRRIALYLFVE